MNDRRIMGFIGDRIAKGFGESMRIPLIIGTTILLFSAMPVAAQVDAIMHRPLPDGLTSSNTSP